MAYLTPAHRMAATRRAKRDDLTERHLGTDFNVVKDAIYEAYEEGVRVGFEQGKRAAKHERT